MSNLKEFNEFAMESTETIQGGMRKRKRKGKRKKTTGIKARFLGFGLGQPIRNYSHRNTPSKGEFFDSIQ